MNESSKSKKNIKVIKLFIISLIFVSIAASIAIVGCNYIGNRNFVETFCNVSSLKVHDKIRIVQLSDLHTSSYGTDNKKLIDRVEKLKPDIIIYTGDMLDSKAENYDKTVALCKTLAKVAPSYYIYGNNEIERYYKEPLTQEALDKRFGFDDENRNPEKLLEITDSFTNALEAAGVKVLKNKAETVTVGSTQVDIYGVLTSNPSSFWLYAGKSFDEFIYTNENNLKIMAIHEPILMAEYKPETWGDLVLAGHTHGGLVRVPILGPLYAYEVGFFPERNENFAYGRFEVQGRPLIVNAGLENKNLLRINNEPEIVIVDINKF